MLIKLPQSKFYDDLAFQELLQRHPVSDPPSCSAPKTASLVVDESAVRDPPIMLIILPIMLCCIAQKFTYYA